VPGLPLDEVIPVHPGGLPALQRFEREGRVVEQERVEQLVRRGERSSAVQVDRAGNRVVGLVDVALEHPRRVAVEEAEYAQAAGNPQVEQRIGGGGRRHPEARARRSEEHTSELQSLAYLVCRLPLEKKNVALLLLLAAVVT